MPVNSQVQRKPFAIGHVAKITGVSVSTLRSWEQQGLINPHKSAGGHRSFTAEDVDRIRRIEQLRRHSGQSLSAIRRALGEGEETASVAEAAPVGAEVETIDFNRLGAWVRSMREAAGLSLRDVSARTEIGLSHLSMFERGSAFLSPARLSALAEVFGRSLAELLGGTDTQDVPIVRRGRGRIVGTFGPGVSIEQLTVAQHLMDAEIWTIDPGRESDGFYAHDGEELIYVLAGELEITLADREPERIGPGDCAYFSSRIQHRWRNTDDRPAQVLWVNTDSERLGSMRFERAARRLGLGPSHGTGMGEGTLNVALSPDAQTFRVIETHTAGHPTRILIEPLSGLDGPSVAEKAKAFAARYDHLRPLLLHEPRGHSGSFGLVPVPSTKADFGAFFVASYGYPTICGHAIFGFAKALSALGRLNGRKTFTVEMPGGIVEVELGSDPASDTVVTMPVSFVSVPRLALDVGGRSIEATIAYGGNSYAIVDAAAVGLDLVPERLDDILATGWAIRQAADAALAEQSARIDAVLFVQSHAGRPNRQFLAIDRHKYDRSPGVTALAARMAQLVSEGRFHVGSTLVVESIFGGRLSGEVVSLAATSGGHRGCVPKITGRAHLNGISTLIHEADDPLGRGFL